MKLAYITVDFEGNKRATPGIARKIENQVKAFNSAGIDTNIIDVKVSSSKFLADTCCIPFQRDVVLWEDVDVEPYDAFYIRRPAYVSKQFLNLLKRIKKQKPLCKVVYEVPTFPYDKEFPNSIHHNLLLAKDRINRVELSYYVDRIVDFFGDKTVFDIPAIQTVNGIDVESVETRKPSGFKPGAPLNIACAASFTPSHGIDRMLYGMKEYYAGGGKRELILHLMGEGCVKRELVELADELCLNDKVHFYGMCNTEQIQQMYGICPFSIGALGIHRVGGKVLSAIKTRECFACGMPFMYSGILDVDKNNSLDFCMQIDDSETPVKIEDVFAFCDNLYANNSEEEIIERMREFAFEYVDMCKTMKPVIDYYLLNTSHQPEN